MVCHTGVLASQLHSPKTFSIWLWGRAGQAQVAGAHDAAAAAGEVKKGGRALVARDRRQQPQQQRRVARRAAVRARPQQREQRAQVAPCRRGCAWAACEAGIPRSWPEIPT
jgi:hypothetical protein